MIGTSAGKLVLEKLTDTQFRAWSNRIITVIATYYIGYGVAHYADFYDLRHVLVLGRVTTGQGGDLLITGTPSRGTIVRATLPRRAQVRIAG